MAVAKNDKVRDKLSGQVVGPSKASGVSFPEAYIMYSDGHDSTLQEFLWARGGNDTLQRAFYQSLRQTGKGRINLEGLSGPVQKRRVHGLRTLKQCTSVTT